jgi:hypothetical protein
MIWISAVGKVLGILALYVLASLFTERRQGRRSRRAAGGESRGDSSASRSKTRRFGRVA